MTATANTPAEVTRTAATVAVQHTPGPWVLSQDGWIWSSAGSPTPAIYVALSGREANARLITSAPDLLNGCNALLGLLQLLASRDDISPEMREFLTTGHRIDEARAAVAKAGA